ncbi:hypothetical protein E3E26_07245 [Thermococcus sp. LS1]|uniref:hypothetical protein n=1 Tax=Thermococcus sp. LS1 TaxID=1638259 RepID=UPI0014397A94|nr:hypothetical protein [Thermococcus sp. LS1]NJD99579.1 hypothetical protein [Thermococcus sp. LS1]
MQSKRCDIHYLVTRIINPTLNWIIVTMRSSQHVLKGRINTQYGPANLRWRDTTIWDSFSIELEVWRDDLWRYEKKESVDPELILEPLFSILSRMEAKLPDNEKKQRILSELYEMVLRIGRYLEAEEYVKKELSEVKSRAAYIKEMDENLKNTIRESQRKLSREAPIVYSSLNNSVSVPKISSRQSSIETRGIPALIIIKNSRIRRKGRLWVSNDGWVGIAIDGSSLKGIVKRSKVRICKDSNTIKVEIDKITDKDMERWNHYKNTYLAPEKLIPVNFDKNCSKKQKTKKKGIFPIIGKILGGVTSIFVGILAVLLLLLLLLSTISYIWGFVSPITLILTAPNSQDMNWVMGNPSRVYFYDIDSSCYTADKIVIDSSLNYLSKETGVKFIELPHPLALLIGGISYSCTPPKTEFAAGEAESGYGGISIFVISWNKIRIPHNFMTQEVVLHETLHAMSFGHSNDPSNIMYPTITGVSTLNSQLKNYIHTWYVKNPLAYLTIVPRNLALLVFILFILISKAS